MARGIPEAVKPVIDAERFPEWQPFLDAVQQRRPDSGTWCEAWTVRDIVIHQVGNAEELARVLGAHLAGEPVGTRGFEEREGPLRDLDDADLWDALLDRMATLNDVAAAAEEADADTDVAWTGRTMKVPWFAEHMREELVLHGWDITGDTDDVLLDARTDHTTIGFAAPEGTATLETDAAARVLLLWGRRPADPSRICSRVGPEALGRLRLLLSGY